MPVTMSCCTNRGYNSTACNNSRLQATHPIVIRISDSQGINLTGKLTMKDLTQTAGTNTWTGNSSTHQLVLTGGGDFRYLGCPSCLLLSTNLEITTEDEDEEEDETETVVLGKWRGTINLVNGVVSGSLGKTQGSVTIPFRYQIEGRYKIVCGKSEGRTLVLQTLRLTPGIF